jgi:O-antigen ligase
VPLAMFGGTRGSVAVPVGLSSIACAIILRPRLRGWLDAALLLLVACVAFQLVPLPDAALTKLSPHAQSVRDALALLAPPELHLRPLSIRSSDTEWAFVIFAGAVAMFFVARSTFGRGGVRRTVWGVAAIGLGVSGLSIAQAATAGRSIYWRFPTEYEGPLPFGPFVNRNHFATWAIMALPLTVGYLMSRSPSPAPVPPDAAGRRRLTLSVDPRGAWMITASVLMLLALLLSLSRSGIVALAIAAGVMIVAMRRRLQRHGRWAIASVVAAFTLAALAWADVPALAERFAATPAGLSGRLTIWRETVPIIGDFWLPGTGAGTYETAMFVYQRSDRSVFFNQAHNHYLQVAAEGGLLVTVTLAIALAVFVVSAIVVMRRDHSDVIWMRAGAATGIGAVMLQSLWETGLVMPANAMLAAILAAIVLHEHEKPRPNPYPLRGFSRSRIRVRHGGAPLNPYVHTSRPTRTPPPR